MGIVIAMSCHAPSRRRCRAAHRGRLAVRFAGHALAVVLPALLLWGCAGTTQRGALDAVPELETMDTSPAADSTFFVCDAALMLSIERDSDGVVVGRGDAALQLAPTRGDHQRFSSDDRELTLREVDADYRVAGHGEWHCVSARVWQGWEEARAEGAVLLGRGNEPGWRLLLRDGDDSTWLADYGEREYRFRLADASAGRGMYRWELETRTDSGERLAIAIEQRECIEDMAGQRYPLQVNVTRNERTYRGCGLWLD